MKNLHNEALNLQNANHELEFLTAPERLQWAHQTFDNGLFSSTSFGVSSAVMLRLVQQSGIEIPVIAIDTGFWFPETHDFKEAATKRFGIDLRVYSPSPAQIEKISGERLWETDLTTYHEITKLAPLRKAIGELSVTALLSGVRRQQTRNRANLDYIDNGPDGEFRIHPILDWTDEQESDFMEQENLPRHPLYSAGYGSVGDRTTTVAAAGRNGRLLGPHLECGLHIKNAVSG